MSADLKNVISKYTDERTGIYAEILVNVLLKGKLELPVSYRGMPHTADLKNYEFLRDAGLLQRDERWAHDNRNEFYVYKLTEPGKPIAEKLLKERTEKKE